MSQRFEYGCSRIKDLQVIARNDTTGKTTFPQVEVEGRPVRAGKRFWSSLHLRFGFTSNIFRYFAPEEVFQRISSVSPNDQLRWCIAWDKKDKGTLLAVSNPTAGLIRHQDVLGLLKRYGAESIAYSNGVVTSTHAPRHGGTFDIAGDKFQNKFVIETPIDGFGRPAAFLSLLRLLCSNGAIGYSPAFRSEVNVGRSKGGTEFALVRVLEGFNNEEGYAALRQRFEAATRSWASVHEVNQAYRTLVRAIHAGQVGGDGASTPAPRSAVLHGFHKMAGDLPLMYGLANLDALSVKRQSTLPSACKVYDLLNFTSEVATHHAADDAKPALQAFIGGLVSSEYDLEGTVEQFGEWRDFFVGNDTAKSIA